MVERSRVVVGFGGGADAAAALLWGVHAARLQRRPLRVVIAANPMDPVLVSDFRERSERLVAGWRDQAERAVAATGLPDASVTVADGAAVAVLRKFVTAGDLLVVGRRAHAPFVETLGGSVSQHLARHVPCPVVVVRPPATPDAAGVVVGVDGSAESLAAVRFGCAWARLTGEDVTLVHAHRSRRHDPARDEAVAGWLRDWLLPVTDEYVDLDVGVDVVNGSAPKVLEERSRTASLLVLGSRGRDAFAGMLLGSTSQDALHRARCPVAIVR